MGFGTTYARLVGLLTPILSYPCYAVPVYSYSGLRGPFFAHVLDNTILIRKVISLRVNSDRIKIAVPESNIFAIEGGPGVIAFALSSQEPAIFRSWADVKDWYKLQVASDYFLSCPVFGIELSRKFNDVITECRLAEAAVEMISNTSYQFAISWVLRSKMSELARNRASDRLSSLVSEKEKSRSNKRASREIIVWSTFQLPENLIRTRVGLVQFMHVNYKTLFRDASDEKRPDYIFVDTGDLYEITFNYPCIEIIRNYRQNGTKVIKIGSRASKDNVLPSAHSLVDSFIGSLDDHGIYDAFSDRSRNL